MSSSHPHTPIFECSVRLGRPAADHAHQPGSRPTVGPCTPDREIRRGHVTRPPHVGRRFRSRSTTLFLVGAALLSNPFATTAFVPSIPGQSAISLPRSPTSARSLPTLNSLSLPPQSGPPGISTVPEPRVQLPVPRPTSLPSLTANDIRCLRAGLNVQKQNRDGWVGSGHVAMDIPCAPDAVWALLLDFASYDSLIDTVREALVKPGSTRDETKATFTLSKFRFKTNVVHVFDEAAQQLTFTLDKASDNIILKEAHGIWFVEPTAEGLRDGHVRVWLSASIRVSKVVPKWIVDYAARRALPRATAWLRPAAMEKQKQLDAGI